MRLVARCPTCGHEFSYPQVAEGRMGTCPKCRKPALLVPPATAPTTGPDEGGTQLGYGPPPGVAPGVPAPPIPPPPPVPVLRSGVLLGNRYEIAEELGRGAFGVVYRAYDTRLERKSVAVKVLLEKALATADAVRRFRAEARLLCQVHHAQVPAVLDLGEYLGQQYIVFAFVNGRTVRELIPPHGFDDPAAAVRLVAKLTRTLHDIYAGQGILHRDVKPANMMVPAGQADGLYLMDFGLAVCHTTDETRTQEGTMMGTLWYMSPEQAGGRISETGHQSDLYSAAAVLYHLLTGRPPFTSKWPAIVADILMLDPEPPSFHRPEIDADLDAIVMRGLSKRAQDRYATGAEFAEQLELWAARALVSGTGSGKVHPHSYTATHGRGTGGHHHHQVGGHTATAGRTAAGPTAANEVTSVGNGSTVNERPARTPPGQVILVKALPKEDEPRPMGLKVAVAALGVLLLGVLVVGLVLLFRPKPEPAPTVPTPQDGGKAPLWKR